MDLIKSIPNEIWQRIFSNLTIPEIQTASLVCRKWRESLQDRRFWRSRSLTLCPENKDLLLSGERILLVDTLRLGNFREEEDKLGEVIQFLDNNGLQLVKLDMGNNELKGLDGGSLASVISRAREVVMRNCRHLSEICHTITAEPHADDLKLKKLSVRGGSQVKLTEAHLMAIITKLEEVSLENLGTSTWNLFLKSLPTLQFVNLKKVSLTKTDLTTVTSDVLAKFVCRLESVNLRECQLDGSQLDGIFQDVVDGVSNLRELDVFGNELMINEPDHDNFAEAACKLEKFAFQYNIFNVNAELESHHGNELATLIGILMEQTDDLKLKSLEMNVTASYVFAFNFSKLESLTYSKTFITQNAFVPFFDVDEASKLKKLTLQECNIVDEVETKVLSSVIGKLDHFVLRYTNITGVQFLAIMFAAQQRLKTLEIEGVPLSFYEPADFANLLCPSKVSRLEKIVLLDCYLTAGHVNVILQKISSGDFRSLSCVTLGYTGDEVVNEDILNIARRSLTVKIIKRKDPTDLKESGNEYFQYGDFSAALSNYTESLKWADTDKERSVVLRNRAAAHLKLNNYQAALADCSRVLEDSPGDVKALYRRSLAYEGLGETELAYRDALEANSIQPNKSIQEILNRLPKNKEAESRLRLRNLK